MKGAVPLEKAAEKVCNASMACPQIYQLPPDEGRIVLEKAQDSPVYIYPAQVLSATVNTGRWGDVPVYLVVPQTVQNPANVIFYIHGAGCQNRLYCGVSGISQSS